MQKFDLQNELYLLRGEAEDSENVSAWNNHFRIVFVRGGNGTAVLDEDSFTYDTGNIFFIKPKQKFHLIPLIKTGIFAVNFKHLPDASALSDGDVDGFSNLYKQLLQIFVTTNSTQAIGIIVCKNHIALDSLIHLLTIEMDDIQKSSGEIIKNGTFLVINILGRNLSESRQIKTESVYHPEIDSILIYIKEQLSQNNKVDLNDIENRFNVGMSSIDRSMIAKTGLSLKKYIVKLKMDLFKNRLLKVSA